MNIKKLVEDDIKAKNSGNINDDEDDDGCHETEENIDFDDI